MKHMSQKHFIATGEPLRVRHGQRPRGYVSIINALFSKAGMTLFLAENSRIEALIETDSRQ